MKLFVEAVIKYLVGLIIVVLLLFIPAGTIYFYNGWLFIWLLFFPMFIVGIVMLIKDPHLLKSRLDVREKETVQKEVIVYSGIMFILGFLVAGLNYRFKWIVLPNIVIIISTIVFIISYILYGVVLKTNTYLSRSIKVVDNQKVIDNGLYGVVRHPMYMITIILFLTIPLILGSIISFGIFLIYPFIIVKRIKNEEIVLERELKGYKEYEKKVRYRLIPFIW
ncbi:MAG: isoprenylcysteine carboxylmethyltransferase family protein [Bacilli bacterium]|nr:isoprenylcysteine carboxylmethyltransferase family protein [Bacilli bacterium]